MALQELCEEKNEFTLFMATLQASVHHPDPDDYGPRAYDPVTEEVTLKRIVDMDGVVVGEEIDIEKSSIIQEDPFDENERIYEQHGRYTGNAGTDWRFWYRKTVLIIMPRTHITDFLVKQFHDSFRYFLSSPRKDRTDSFSIRHLIDYMIRRLQKARRGVQLHHLAKDELRQVCSWVLEQVQLISSYGWKRTQPDNLLPSCQPRNEGVLHSLIRASCILEDYLLIEKATALLEQELPEWCIALISFWIWLVGFKPLRKGLENALPPRRSISAMRMYLQGLLQKTITNPVSQDHANMQRLHEEGFIDWIHEQLENILQHCTEFTADDCKALAQILKETEHVKFEEKHEQAVSIIKRFDVNATLIWTFLTELASGSDLVKDTQRKGNIKNVFKQFLPVVISDFAIQESSDDDGTKCTTDRLAQPSEPHHSTIDGTTVAKFMGYLLDLGFHDEFGHILESFSDSPGPISQLCLFDFPSSIVPFLKQLGQVLQKRGISLGQEKYQSLFKTVLKDYLLNYVKMEPLRPQDWKRPPVACSCSDCQTDLASFLDDRYLRGKAVRASDRRLKHLQSQLPGDGEYVFTTIRLPCPPWTLVIQKTEAAWQKEWEVWIQRRKRFHQDVRMLGESIDLKEALGDKYEEIVEEKLVRQPPGKNDYPATEVRPDAPSPAAAGILPTSQQQQRTSQDISRTRESAMAPAAPTTIIFSSVPTASLESLMLNAHVKFFGPVSASATTRTSETGCMPSNIQPGSSVDPTSFTCWSVPRQPSMANQTHPMTAPALAHSYPQPPLYAGPSTAHTPQLIPPVPGYGSPAIYPLPPTTFPTNFHTGEAHQTHQTQPRAVYSAPQPQHTVNNQHRRSQSPNTSTSNQPVDAAPQQPLSPPSYQTPQSQIPMTYPSKKPSPQTPPVEDAFSTAPPPPIRGSVGAYLLSCSAGASTPPKVSTVQPQPKQPLVPRSGKNIAQPSSTAVEPGLYAADDQGPLKNTDETRAGVKRKAAETGLINLKEGEDGTVVKHHAGVVDLTD